MNNTKNITKRMMSKQKTMLGVISNAIKNNMKTSALVLGLMGFPMFSSMASNPSLNSGNITSSSVMESDLGNITEINLQYPHLSIANDGTTFQNANNKVVAIKLSGENVSIHTINKDSSRSDAVINNDRQTYVPALLAATTTENLLEANRVAMLTGANIRSQAMLVDLIKQNIDAQEIAQDSKTRQNIDSELEFKHVEGFDGYIEQCKIGNKNVIVPVQDVTTEININTSYGKKQIFGITAQAEQLLAKEYSNSKDKLKSNGEKVELNLTFDDNVPEKNKEIIASIYAQVYAEKLDVKLDNISVSCIKESDATFAAYLNENYNELKKAENFKKVIVLNLNYNGLTMKGLMNKVIYRTASFNPKTLHIDSPSIELTKSKAYDNISGDLINQAIFNAMKTKIINASKNREETAKRLKKDMAFKNKCLKAQEEMQKLFFSDAHIMSEIEIGNSEFDFSREDLKKALENFDKSNLIETFKNDIKEGVKEMFGESQDLNDIEFVITGESVRLACLQDVIQELTSGHSLTKTLNMETASSTGASYISLLRDNNLKQELSKKVDDPSTILEKIEFENKYKPMLDQLLMQKRNAIQNELLNILEIDKTNLKEKLKTNLISEKLREKLNNTMEGAVKHFKDTKVQSEHLVFVHEVMPIFCDFLDLVSTTAAEKNLSKEDLEGNEDCIMNLLTGIRSGISQILNNYTKEATGLTSLKKSFLEQLHSNLFFVESNSDSNLLKDPDFKNKFDSISTRLKNNFKI